MTFEKIDKKLKSLRDPELGDDVLDRIGAWLHGLRAAMPELRERLDREVARLEAEASGDFGRLASEHAAGAWLLRRRAGKLSSEHLGCSTPEHVALLGKALGVELPTTPLPE
jgi:hypothetical protein